MKRRTKVKKWADMGFAEFSQRLSAKAVDKPVDGGGKPITVPVSVGDDVKPPMNRADFEKLLSQSVARAVALATTSKDYSEATKIGIEVFKVLYPESKEEPWGAGLNAAKVAESAYRTAAPGL